ncbi:hypothetical protein Nepgr_021419 [Nepenthes gracilis]|uniref:Uncharacterized protein n=1 Tax=Nepenthes gracilis TaxID=150966 RepID=A0AAD3SWS5_NEPGR|nr:hypothetical protein Nepgr_021419 [Nepenthes gracilis]
MRDQRRRRASNHHNFAVKQRNHQSTQDPEKQSPSELDSAITAAFRVIKHCLQFSAPNQEGLAHTTPAVQQDSPTLPSIPTIQNSNAPERAIESLY